MCTASLAGSTWSMKGSSRCSKKTRRRCCVRDSREWNRARLPIEDTLNAPWLGEYVVELVGFPGTKHNDQVDSTTQALHYLREPNVVATFIKAFL
jgi:phage terminase large subunit-like protein